MAVSSQIQALGYIGVAAQGIDEWAHFGTRFLGMQAVDRTAKRLSLRMDDRKQRVIIEDEGRHGLGYIGWETADQAALDALAARLESRGVVVKRGDRPLCDERRVRDLIRFVDPLGNQMEAFWGAETTTEAFVPGRSISGFRTGPLGMGHAVLHVEDVDAVVPFYRDVLGFRTSDYMVKPFKAHFFHVNARQHSLALIQTGRRGFHHFMMELYNLDDVGQAYDIAQGMDDKLILTMGRHTNDHMTSFYTKSPSGFGVEYGWGGRHIDPETWVPHEMTKGGSLWGHDLVAGDAEMRQKRRQARMEAANTGLREPVSVMEGNYQLTTGVCPWWDQAAGRGK
jgi:2,3-dihydroxybiphenyl 1,2-dioxygenase